MVSLLMVPHSVHASVRASQDYTITAEVLDCGGTAGNSSNYAILGSAGCVGSGVVAAPATAFRIGYMGQLCDLSSLQIIAATTTVNEGSSRQLSALATMDDDTFTKVLGSDLTWDVLSGPISSVSSQGLASAGLIYENTVASVQGVYGGISRTMELTVLNVNTDDYFGYSGDGIDDAWQVQYFGLNNPSAAPGKYSDASGLTNWFKFIAGLSPNNSSSRFSQIIMPVPGQFGWRNVIFSPIVAGRTYSVQFSFDMSPGSWQNLTEFNETDNGNTRTVTDLNASGPRKFYRVQITMP